MPEPLQEGQFFIDATGELTRFAAALLVERQQDKERIERLETALFQIATCLDVDVSQVLASRALAVEEDARG